VRVKILAIDEKNGRINLSIKKAEAPGTGNISLREKHPEPVFSGAPRRQPACDESFEEKLKAFMRDSESKLCDMKKYPERKGGIPRRLRAK
jgi:S1 RNA binding domain protein